MELLYIILALTIGSIGSVALAGLLLLLPDNKLFKTANYLISLAGGTLLGAAFLGMLPKAITFIDAKSVFNITLGGILVFFIIEKVILWRSCQNRDCQRHQDASAQLILIGDAFHNFIDGVVITTAFYTSVPFGIIVTFSVLAHEIPQELADFGILLKNGFSKKRAILFNILSGSTTLLGGILTYFALDVAKSMIPYILAVSASSFIYIALADLVPQMHQKTKIKDSIIQIVLILTGISIIYIIKNI